ncbi:hypothetical protein C8R31_10661 [Nitrosospira sp. Nsp2]|uniref:hypothetical protein n=1 Tax=Nitrosospira sp. Nsp2 TaxID=136548 RepID=UPI000D4BF5FA|nr:hypothetical protein [Nitrosospira sp. Nsp2]PTR14389.1 hypothetical protein C8R31_10661 [Nitrosospira sp. Nsp2]
MTGREERMLKASQGMVITITITITILNSSSAELEIQAAELTGGNWSGTAPVAGTVLAAGSTSYINVGASISAGVGGIITLIPASGGSISMSWNWTPTNPAIAYGVVSGTSTILLSYSAANASTYSPMVTYVISDAGVAEQPEMVHAKRPI